MGGFVPTGSGILVFDIEAWLGLVVFAVLLVIKIFAFVLSLVYSAESYDAAGKLNKTTWCLLLGLAMVLQIAPIPIALINLIFVIVPCVFLADVRPAIGNLKRR